MSRPSIRLVDVRAVSLIPGDVVLHNARQKDRHTDVWTIVDRVDVLKHDPDRVAVYYKGVSGPAVMQAVALVTIQTVRE